MPLAKQNPTTALFTAIGTFQSCLTGLGVTFVGAPNPNDPNSPPTTRPTSRTSRPARRRATSSRPSRAEQTAQDNLTPAQIKEENKGYLKWRTCMIGRGWGIPEPKPNSKGLLFSFGGTRWGRCGRLHAAAGPEHLVEPDVQACAAKAQGEALSVAWGLTCRGTRRSSRRSSSPCWSSRAASATRVSQQLEPGGTEQGPRHSRKVQRRTLQDTVTLNGTLARKEIRNVTASSQGRVSAVYTTNGTNGQRRRAAVRPQRPRRHRRAGHGALLPVARSPATRATTCSQLKQILAAAGDDPGPMNN